MSSGARSWPQTVEQAVDQLLTELSSTDKVAIAQMVESDLIELHFGLGMYIRNAFGLWHGNDALVSACSTAGNGFIHPDDASGIIIEALWKRLRTQS